MNLRQRLLLPLAFVTALPLTPKTVQAQEVTEPPKSPDKDFSLSAKIGPFIFIDSPISDFYKFLMQYGINAGVKTSANTWAGLSLSYLNQTTKTPRTSSGYQKNTFGASLLTLWGISTANIPGKVDLYGTGGLSLLGGIESATLFNNRGQVQEEQTVLFSGWGTYFGGGIELKFNESFSASVEADVYNLAIGETPGIWAATAQVGVTYRP